MRYHKFVLVIGIQRCKASKLGFKETNLKNPANYVLFSEWIVFGRPGFDPRSEHTLRVNNPAVPWSARTYSISFERSNLYLIE